ncbi:MAG TPA: sulfatase [Candidatus Limnocylindria bacterium]|nr:sulfatase [Candidatus Limnocylindria bacterium]
MNRTTRARLPRSPLLVAIGLVVTGLVAAALLQRPGAGGGAAKPTAPRALVYLVDTLRRDRLGIYGYHRPTSPRIDALARECAIFDRAYAPAPWTLPSVVSLLTSTDPLAHGVFTRGQRADARTRSLAEALHAHGWRTAGFITNPFAGKASGLDRGYDRFEAVSDQTIDPAWVANWLGEARERPAFAYVHTAEPHKPYRSPQHFRDRLADVPARRRKQLNRQMRILHHLTNWDFRRHQPKGATKNDAQQARLRRELAKGAADLSMFYDAEVAWADDNFGRLADRLRADGTWDSTLVLFISDHGEEFFEHGDVSHGQSLYAELVRIPMVVCHPGGLGVGRRIDAVVSLLDVMPTVLAYAGIPATGLAGRDLTPLLRGEDFPGTAQVTSVRINRHKYAPEIEAKRGAVNVAVADGRWRAIWNVQTDTVELYDTEADPGEQVDRAAEEPERAAALAALAREWAEGRWPSDVALEASRTDELDEDTVRRLRAIGYLP